MRFKGLIQLHVQFGWSIWTKHIKPYTMFIIKYFGQIQITTNFHSYLVPN